MKKDIIYLKNLKLDSSTIIKLVENGVLTSITVKEVLKLVDNKVEEVIVIKNDENGIICKILNVGKYLYEKEKNSKGSTQKTKNINIQFNINKYDLNRFKSNIINFLEKKHRVTIIIKVRSKDKNSTINREKFIEDLLEPFKEISNIQRQNKIDVNTEEITSYSIVLNPI